MIGPGWMSTEEAALEVGMSTAWVRKQIDEGRLSSYVIWTTGRRIFRIDRRDWQRFLAEYRGRADDPRFANERIRAERVE